MRENYIISKKQRFDLSANAISTPELFGTWQHVGSGRNFLIETNSFYFVFDGPYPYHVSSATLDLDGWIFDRIYGNGSDIVGVWREPTTLEEVTFRPDGSYSWYDPSGIDTFGTFETTSTPDMMKTAEARAYLTEVGNQLTFDTIFGGSYVFDYSVNESQLTLTNTSEIIEYVRVT